MGSRRGGRWRLGRAVLGARQVERCAALDACDARAARKAIQHGGRAPRSPAAQRALRALSRRALPLDPAAGGAHRERRGLGAGAAALGLTPPLACFLAGGTSSSGAGRLAAGAFFWPAIPICRA